MKKVIYKIGIVGTGAVGGFFGGKLALAGYNVVFLSRGDTLKILQQNGLIVDSLGEISNITRATFTSNAAELESCDLIIFTVKSYDTEDAINQIKPHINRNAIILTPQNSILNDKVLIKHFGKHKVIPGFAKVGVTMPKPGYVKHTGLGIINFGEYDGSVSNRVKQIKEVFSKASVQAEIHENIQLARWKKYVWNCTFNIIAAITEQPLNVILDYKPSYDLCVKTIVEIRQIALAEGINFEREDVVETSIGLARKLGNFKPSTLDDIEKGKTIELDAFTGELIRLANKHHIQIPINEALYALLSAKVKSV